MSYAAGNLTGSPDLSSNYLYEYDAENRLIDAGGVTYTYDGDGNRAIKVSGGTTRIYFRSGLDGQVLEEWITGVRDKFYISVAGEHLATFTPGPAVTSRRHPLATLPT